MKMSTNWGSSYGFNGLSGFRGLGSRAEEREGLWALASDVGDSLDATERVINTAASLGASSALLADWRGQLEEGRARLAAEMSRIDDPALVASEAVMANVDLQSRSLRAAVERALTEVPTELATRVGLWTGFGVLATVGVVLGVAYYSRKRTRRRRR